MDEQSSQGAAQSELFAVFGDVQFASGGRSKHNRIFLRLPKDHQHDALCVGELPRDEYTAPTRECFLAAYCIVRGCRFRKNPAAAALCRCSMIAEPIKKALWFSGSKHHPGARPRFEMQLVSYQTRHDAQQRAVCHSSDAGKSRKGKSSILHRDAAKYRVSIWNA